MRSSIFIFCCCMVALVSGCTKPPPEIPAGVLKPKEMVPLLVDIHIAQAATHLYTASDTARYTFNDYLTHILSVHNIGKAVYDSSISYYTLHPEIMSQIYDEVIIELSKKQGEAAVK